MDRRLLLAFIVSGSLNAGWGSSPPDGADRCAKGQILANRGNVAQGPDTNQFKPDGNAYRFEIYSNGARVLEGYGLVPKGDYGVLEKEMTIRDLTIKGSKQLALTPADKANGIADAWCLEYVWAWKEEQFARSRANPTDGPWQNGQALFVAESRKTENSIFTRPEWNCAELRFATSLDQCPTPGGRN